jgi:Ubiquitin carboxyl-terminal hydrolase, family 1
LKQIVFNVMLREWGVHGIQVNEVVPLDAIFDSSPTSTFGLIFLSRYTSSKGGNQAIKIPDSLWFANQVSLLPCPVAC